MFLNLCASEASGTKKRKQTTLKPVSDWKNPFLPERIWHWRQIYYAKLLPRVQLEKLPYFSCVVQLLQCEMCYTRNFKVLEMDKIHLQSIHSNLLSGKWFWQSDNARWCIWRLFWGRKYKKKLQWSIYLIHLRSHRPRYKKENVLKRGVENIFLALLMNILVGLPTNSIYYRCRSNLLYLIYLARLEHCANFDGPDPNMT